MQNLPTETTVGVSSSNSASTSCLNPGGRKCTVADTRTSPFAVVSVMGTLSLRAVNNTFGCTSLRLTMCQEAPESTKTLLGIILNRSGIRGVDGIAIPLLSRLRSVFRLAFSHILAVEPGITRRHVVSLPLKRKYFTSTQSLKETVLRGIPRMAADKAVPSVGPPFAARVNSNLIVSNNEPNDAKASTDAHALRL